MYSSRRGEKALFKLSRRLEELPPYIFSELSRLESEARGKGLQVLSLGIGDPDQPTPIAIVDCLKTAATDPSTHTYSPYAGSNDFRNAVKRWFVRRFGVDLDAESEITAVIGTKEGIAHFPLAFCNPGDVCLFPSPGYPVYAASIVLAGGIPMAIPMTSEFGFLPELDKVEFLLLKHRPRYLVINFPSNPTSVTCPRGLLVDLVFLARKYGTIVVSDGAYSEIYFDEADKPMSILEVEGAKDVAIEFHSFSKTFNMAGWRLGFAVGNPDLVGGLRKVKTNIDSGPPLFVQRAGIVALEHYEGLSGSIREMYRQRQELLCQGLDELGIKYLAPKATFFVWAQVPDRQTSMVFTKRLLAEQGLVVTPGIGFGEHGDGYVRMALTLEPAQIKEALLRLSRFLGQSRS